MEPPVERFAIRKAGQGRPVGYLVAWLHDGLADSLRAAHWAEYVEPTREQRLAARAVVKTLRDGGDADAALILGCEAPAPLGDESEPEVVP